MSDREQMDAAARRRDSAWDTDPPINRGLYFEGWEDARDFYRSPAIELAKALRQLVNAGLPPDLDLERPFWVAARNARATLSVYTEITGVDGEQDA